MQFQELLAPGFVLEMRACVGTFTTWLRVRHVSQVLTAKGQTLPSLPRHKLLTNMFFNWKNPSGFFILHISHHISWWSVQTDWIKDVEGSPCTQAPAEIATTMQALKKALEDESDNHMFETNKAQSWNLSCHRGSMGHSFQKSFSTFPTWNSQVLWEMWEAKFNQRQRTALLKEAEKQRKKTMFFCTRFRWPSTERIEHI